MIEDMQLIMNDERLDTIKQVTQFLEGSKALEFGGISGKERYRWIETVLCDLRIIGSRELIKV